MKKPRVLLDVDGVLCSFLEPAMDILNRLTGLNHTAAELREWDLFSLYPRELAGFEVFGRPKGPVRNIEQEFFAACNTPGFCEALPVIPGAVEFVAQLQEVAEVFIVTSPMHHNETWTYEREQWLARHFNIPKKRVVHTMAKHLCVGDYLIDDHPDNIAAWESEHSPKGTGLLWATTYNASSQVGHRVTGPAEVMSYLSSTAHE